MMDCKPMTTTMITNLKRLRSFESSLVNTRPHICFAVNVLIQFRVEPKHDHWIAAKHILRFLQGTTNYFLKYDKGNDVHLIGYTDYDWGGSEQDGRSTT